MKLVRSAFVIAAAFIILGILPYLFFHPHLRTVWQLRDAHVTNYTSEDDCQRAERAQPNSSLACTPGMELLFGWERE